jgi:hypothetical protein
MAQPLLSFNVKLAKRVFVSLSCKRDGGNGQRPVS